MDIIPPNYKQTAIGVNWSYDHDDQDQKNTKSKDDREDFRIIKSFI